MGIAERKDRDKIEMRGKILQAAKEIFVEKGFDGASIRNIAEKVEYSPATIYLYFKDKDEMLFAVHEMAFEKLFALLESLGDIIDPLERIHAMGQTYFKFALDNPDLYDLMFILREPMNKVEPQGGWDCGFRTYNLFRDTIVEAIEQKRLKSSGNADITAVSLWATIHGLASLYIRNRFKMLPQEALPYIIEGAIRAPIENARP